MFKKKEKEINVFDEIGIEIPRLLFPNREKVDLEKWATIACDQYTSQPDYWEEVESFVGDAPSTLNLMMPEAWLNDPERKAHQDAIPSKMQEYLDEGYLEELAPGFMFIHRQMSTGNYRRGLLVLLDLDKYDYDPSKKTLCRASEETVEERLPSRIEIRKKAIFEMPHAMVLLNDKGNMLMKQLDSLIKARAPFYNFELMQDGGQIRGWHIHRPEEIEVVVKTLTMLKGSSVFTGGMMYVVGDGNHSLAAAKKAGDRYALVELVNLYDLALCFQPIHRLLDADGNVVDYIHGQDECEYIAEQKGLTADIRKPYPKVKLWTTVLRKGTLPKKTFSIGNAVDKRFYLECCMRK